VRGRGEGAAQEYRSKARWGGGLFQQQMGRDVEAGDRPGFLVASGSFAVRPILTMRVEWMRRPRPYYYYAMGGSYARRTLRSLVEARIFPRRRASVLLYENDHRQPRVPPQEGCLPSV
jgi:hypothetical protein